MEPADDPNTDYKALVARGYDQCAAEYEAARRAGPVDALDLLTQRVPAGGRVLDLGCGAGVPVALALAQRYRVTGVDISAEQVRRAQRNVPAAEFIHADLMSAGLPAGHFDAAVAFYAIFHLPREEHAGLFARVRRWLKPGGYFLATLAEAAEAPYLEHDFFGATMYWSNYGLDDYRRLLAEAGFSLVDLGTLDHGYYPEASSPAEQHPLVLAQATEAP